MWAGGGAWRGGGVVAAARAREPLKGKRVHDRYATSRSGRQSKQNSGREGRPQPQGKPARCVSSVNFL